MVRGAKVIFISVLVLFISSFAYSSEEPAAQAATLQAFSSPAMRFEPNMGQTDACVQFLSRGPGYVLFLKPGEAVFSLSKKVPGAHEGSKDCNTPIQNDRLAFSMKIGGARADAKTTTRNQLPGVSNYYRGNDSEKWVTGVPAFGRVEYKEVYPGIDLVYRGNQNQLEYDFVLAPGAEPERIRLTFEGVDALDVSGDGHVVLDVAGEKMVHKAPRIFQEIHGDRNFLEGRFVLRGEFEVGFEVKGRDEARELVIDPEVLYSTWLGGSLADSVNGIGVDSSGNVYLAGTTRSSDFPSATGVVTGEEDAFVAKLDASGSSAIYTTFLGGMERDGASDLALNTLAGDVFVSITGYTYSTDFPTTAGAFQTTFGGDSMDGYMARLDETGILDYSTFVGGAFSENFLAIAVDSAGKAYMTGWAQDGFPTTLGAYAESINGNQDAFLTVIDPKGSGEGDLYYSTYMGGLSSDRGVEIAVDVYGNVYFTGWSTSSSFYGPYFPTTPEAYRPTQNIPNNSSYTSNFMAKVEPLGNGVDDLVYSTFLFAEPYTQWARAIAVDEFGRAYVGGECHDVVEPTPGAYDGTYNGGKYLRVQDSYILVLNTTVAGSAGLEYATYFGSYHADSITDIVVQGASLDAPGTIYFAGSVGYETPHDKDKTITPFPATPDAFKSELDPFNMIWDGFFGVLEPIGNGTSDLVFCTLIGGVESDGLAALTLDQNGDVYLGGSTSSDSSTFFPTFTDAIGSRLEQDAIALKIQLVGGTPPAAPDNLVATAVSTTQIELTWTDNADNEDGFVIERSPDGLDWNSSFPVGADTTYYLDGGLTTNTKYYYRVKAHNSAGYSAYSDIASATTLSNGGGGIFKANADIFVAGEVEGTYLDTQEEDDVWERIVEVESGGKPSKRYSYLEHKWTINIGGGSDPVFWLKADRSAVYGVDDFVFAYSTDDVTYIDMITVTETYIEDSFPLPPTLTGTVYIRVRDTDRGAGNKEIDGIRVDHMYIETE